METRSIRIFLQVADIGNLTRAAEVLGMSQATVTRLVRRLEQDIGALLFERHRTGVCLTEAGRGFVQRVSPLLDELDAVREDLTQAKPALSGPIRVGLPHAFRSRIALPFVRRFLAEFPEVSVSLQLGISHEIEQGLAFGMLDLGVLISPQTQAPLEVHPLAREPLYLVTAAGDRPGTAGRTVDWEAVARLPLFLPPVQNPLRRHVEKSIRQAGHALDLRAEISSADLTMDLVETGAACTVHPGSISRRQRAEGRLLGHPIDRETVVWSLATSGHGPRSWARRVAAETLEVLTKAAIDERDEDPVADSL